MQGSDNVKKKGPNLSAKLGNHERENLDLRFWDVTSYRLYGGTCYLHLGVRRYSVH